MPLSSGGHGQARRVGHCELDMVESIRPLPAVGPHLAPVSVPGCKQAGMQGKQRWCCQTGAGFTMLGPCRQVRVCRLQRMSMALCLRHERHQPGRMSALDVAGRSFGTAQHRRRSSRAANFQCSILQSIPECQLCRGQHSIATIAREGHGERHWTASGSKDSSHPR